MKQDNPRAPRTTAFWNEWEPQCADATQLAELLFEHGVTLESDLFAARNAALSEGIARGQLETELAASRALSESLAKALDSISKWNLPKHYELNYGSNGARDYFKGLAERALEAWRAAK